MCPPKVKKVSQINLVEKKSIFYEKGFQMVLKGGLCRLTPHPSKGQHNRHKSIYRNQTNSLVPKTHYTVITLIPLNTNSEQMMMLICPRK